LIGLLAGIASSQFALNPEREGAQSFFIGGCIKFNDSRLRDEIYDFINLIISKPAGKMHRVTRNDFPESDIYDIIYRIKTTKIDDIRLIVDKLEQLRTDVKIIDIASTQLSFDTTNYSKVTAYDEYMKK